MALAVRRGPHPDGGRAVLVDLDRAELLAAAAGGDLDVDADPDAELPAVAGCPPAACSARSAS